MTDAETLKYARNILMTLHKSLIDFERAQYEMVHGKLNASQFLNLLLEDEKFAWLRKFSMLIVEVDEMFDLKDGISAEMVITNLAKMRQLVAMEDPDEYFKSKYKSGIEQDQSAAESHSRLQALLDV